MSLAQGVAQAAPGDVFARGVSWCASTYPGHGTISGFGPALDLNGRNQEDFRWPLYAPAAGTVRIKTRGWGDGWGNSLIWTSEDGREEIQMAHLDSFGKRGRVAGGDLVGRIGQSGEAQGAHVHTAERRDGHPATLVLDGHPIRGGGCYTSRGPQVVRCAGRRATIVGTSGADRLTGTSGPDVIAGLGGNDHIRAGGGHDVICGGRGNDVLDGGPGDDRLVGGRGADLVVFSDASRRVRVSLENGRATGAGSDRIDGVEDVRGSRFGDRIEGGDGPNLLMGMSGNDVLIGSGGRDEARGSYGSDWCSAEKTEGCERPKATAPAAPSPTPGPVPSGLPSPPAGRPSPPTPAGPASAGLATAAVVAGCGVARRRVRRA